MIHCRLLSNSHHRPPGEARSSAHSVFSVWRWWQYLGLTCQGANFLKLCLWAGFNPASQLLDSASVPAVGLSGVWSVVSQTGQKRSEPFGNFRIRKDVMDLDPAEAFVLDKLRISGGWWQIISLNHQFIIITFVYSCCQSAEVLYCFSCTCADKTETEIRPTHRCNRILIDVFVGFLIIQSKPW